MALYLAGVSFCCLMALGFYAYKIIRRRFPVAVSCWFCGEKCEIPWDQINAWDCSHCDQYNGFAEDGHYNKTIPAQFCEELNIRPHIKSKSRVVANGKADQTTSILCGNCSRNQCLKVKQLANFVPLAEESFDVEVDAYRHHLEQVYRLCHVCDTSVRKELARQDAEIRAKITDSGAFSIRRRAMEYPDSAGDDVQFGTRQRIARIFHVLSSVCAFALVLTGIYAAYSQSNLRLPLSLSVEFCLKFLSDRIVPLLIFGTFAKIAAIFISGLIRLHVVDTCSCFSWLMMMLLFLLLEDSHIYSRALVSARLVLSIVNLSLAVISGQKLRSGRTKTPEHLSKISPNIQLSRNDSSSFSLSESAEFSDEDSSYHENSKEFLALPCVKLRQLKLGTSVPKGKNRDPFKVFGNSALSNVIGNMPVNDQFKNGFTRQHPILSPPKFCPSGRSAHYSSPSQKSLLPNGLWSGSLKQQLTNVHTGKSTLDMRFSCSEATFDKKQHSSKTSSEADSDNSSFTALSQEQRSVGTSIIVKIILAISLIVNIVAILLVSMKFQTGISVDAVKTYLQNLLLS